MSTTETNYGASIRLDEGGWEYVRQAIWRGLLRRFPRVRRHELEDAVSFAMAALMDAWLSYPSSVSEDPSRNTSYACFWGIGEGSRYLGSLFDENARLVGLVDTEDEGVYPVTVGPDGIEAQAIRRDPEPDPLAEELSKLTDEELREWWHALA